MSTAYHPQSDGQTERLNRLNRCLEQILRSMAGQRPHKWASWLALAEWWYNSTYNSAIKMAPFEALYGMKPRQLCFNTETGSPVAPIEEFQVQREAMNHLLKETLLVSQSKYKQFADKRRTETTLQIGD